MPISINSLPIELLDLILEDSSLDQAALKSCSLIHRSWVAPSRKHIFAELCVGRDKGFEGTQSDVSKCEKLLDILQTSPHIASYFCRVIIIVHPHSDPSIRKAKLLSEILPKLNHVHSLMLGSSISQRLHYAYLQSELQKAISKLVSNSSFESLTLHEWIFAEDASNFVELIGQCSKSLKYLALSDLHFNALSFGRSNDPHLPLELPSLQEYRIRSASIFVHKQLFTLPRLAKIYWPIHCAKEGDGEEECASAYTLAGMSTKSLAQWSFHVNCDGLFLETGHSTNLTIQALKHLNDILPPSSESQIASIIVTFLLECEPYQTWDEDQWEEVIYNALPPILNDHSPEDDGTEMQRSVAFVFKVGTWTTPEAPSPEVVALVEEFGDYDDALYTDTQKFGNGAYSVKKMVDYAQDILEDKFVGHLASGRVSFTTLYNDEAWIF
ncbi:hypothetical protein ONZ45_g5399 [Pleurotus djamor]|nr:hypothetical protein ONZ45_g5399 [Pleurotus djamor]